MVVVVVVASVSRIETTLSEFLVVQLLVVVLLVVVGVVLVNVVVLWCWELLRGCRCR